MVRRAGTPRANRRDEVRGNSRLKRDLAEKDGVIATQAETIDDLQRQITSLRNAFENFRDRDQGFAASDHSHSIANLSGKVQEEQFADSTVPPTALKQGIPGGKLADETVTFEEIADNTIGRGRMDEGNIYDWLDGRYRRL